MAAAIITIPIPSCADAIALCRSTSTCPVVRLPPRRCSTASCSCRRKSAAPAPSSDRPAHMDERLHELGAAIVRALPGAVTGYAVAFGELTITAEAPRIVEVVTFLRDDTRCQFWCPIDITAVDWPSRERRFDVVYHFLSPKQNQRIRVKIETDEGTPVPSIIDAFEAANWYEREIYDLYGILFAGHPDLRRILTD